MAKKNIFLKIATLFLFAIAPVLVLFSACGGKKASRFTITVRASVPTEKIEFFTNNPVA